LEQILIFIQERGLPSGLPTAYEKGNGMRLDDNGQSVGAKIEGRKPITKGVSTKKARMPILSTQR